jgi:hypothetical protein
MVGTSAIRVGPWERKPQCPRGKLFSNSTVHKLQDQGHYRLHTFIRSLSVSVHIFRKMGKIAVFGS